MAKFFFDFCQGGEVVTDDHGLPFESAEKAYLECYNAAVEMWGDLLRQRRDPRRCAFQIRDAEGQVLFIVPFTEMLDSCRDAPPTSTFSSTYRKALLSVERTHRARAALDLELSKTRSGLKEAARLIAENIGDGFGAH